jgi:elongation factor P
MSTTADIKNGAVINFKNARMKIVEFQHVKPGKGPAFVRTKLKDIQTGKIIDHTFNSGAKLEFIRVTSRKFQYLYKDGDSYVFMDNNTYEQVNVDKVLMDDGHYYIKEGDNIEISFDDEEIISLLLPSKTILKVAQTDPGHKGNTATNALKPATLETGLEVQVPLFINEGDLVKIDTKDGSYSERVKQ